MGDEREKGGADEDGGVVAGDGAEGVLCHSSYAAGSRGVCSGLLFEVCFTLFVALLLCVRLHAGRFFFCFARRARLCGYRPQHNVDAGGALAARRRGRV